jgi:glycosyltransferase involved in cell wall biosynthesis
MPTERAHGIQVMKSCEALAAHGVDLTLYYTSRWQPPELRDAEPFDYYDVERTFRIRSLPYVDLIRFHGQLPWRLIGLGLVPANLLFGLTSTLLTMRKETDYYYTRDWTTAISLVWLGLPTVLEVHQAGTQHVSDRAVRIIRHLSRRSNMRLVVTISNALRHTLKERGVPEEKIAVLPDAVDPSTYATNPSTNEARNSVNLAEDGGLVVYTGSLLPGKGVDVLVESAAHLKATNVVLVGGADVDLSRVERLVEERGLSGVRLVGPVKPPQVADYQRAADVLVLPQLDLEAQSPLKLYEYMAAGRPIVASDLPPIREVLEHGKTALLVPPGDPVALAEAISRLISNPTLAGSLASAARDQVLEWTWSVRAARLLEKLDVVS